jgi:alkanesulfonate monooxygenase SsuD/methylene tetrahydromethanopterin reductase-like flavin-dependent oxidoreductase (luciferase family)
MKETVDIVRLAFAGEKLAYEGKYHRLPLPGGEGKALRLAQPANTKIPIYLATLGPQTLEYTGEAADGWLGTSFTPEHGDAHVAYLKRGAAKAGRDFSTFDVQVGGTVAFGDDLDALVAPLKAGVAFTLGAMGSPKTNFYNEAYRRGGYEEAGIEVQKLWVAGRRDEAIARVPEQMVIEGNLLGTEAMVKDRIRAFAKAGVTTLRLAPAGATLEERLATLGRAMNLVKEVAP